MVKLKGMPDVTVSTSAGSGEKSVIVNIRTEFANRLRRRIDQKGMTQSDLSRATGLGRDSISAYTNGKSLPTAENAKRIADILNCLVTDLIPNYDLGDSSKTHSPFYIDPVNRPGQARVTIAEWLDLDTARKIVDLYLTALSRRSTPPEAPGRPSRSKNIAKPLSLPDETEF